MRLRDFADNEEEFEVEESGMVNLFGLGGYEALGETRFEWTQELPYSTSGISLDLGPKSRLTDDQTTRIIRRLGLPVWKSMTASELIDAFGAPESDTRGRAGLRLLRFLCGYKDSYVLGCCVDDRYGLIEFFFARKDHCDANDAL